jgi:hypothetical protein
MITSEHLVTLLAIVPKYSQKDWLSSYEKIDTFVVRLNFGCACLLVRTSQIDIFFLITFLLKRIE